MLIRNLRLPKRCDLPISQVTGRNYSTVPPLEPRVLLCGDQDSPLPAILRNGDGLGQRDVLVCPDVAMEFGRADSYGVVCAHDAYLLEHAHFTDNPDHMQFG